MAKQYDLVIKTGSYTNNAGETKNRYENIGVVIQGDNGPYMMIKRTFNPAGAAFREGSDSIMVSMFEPKDNQPAQQQRPQQQAPQNNSGFDDSFDDDIAF